MRVRATRNVDGGAAVKRNGNAPRGKERSKKAERLRYFTVAPRETQRLSIRVRSVRPLFKAAAVICATNSVCALARKLLAS
jgi:hypothetical protein